MQIEQIKEVFASVGRCVKESDIAGYYRVDGSTKHMYRSLRSLEREVKTIIKQQKKAVRRSAT